MKTSSFKHLRELALVFLRLGAVSFGGPAVHIGLLEDEFVKRRKWISREKFLDRLGAANLIPGPNSTELAMHLGYARSGFPGLLIAGFCFILPAALLTAALAWLYERYNALPSMTGFLAGLKPAILAVLFFILFRLGKTAFKNRLLAVTGLAAVFLALLGAGEITALFGAGAFGTLLLQKKFPGKRLGFLALIPFISSTGTALAAIGAASSATLGSLALVFLKIGALLYGSGYVLILFLREELVTGRGWLTEARLIDAVAAGQLTPGPLFSTATFTGWLILGPMGALTATAAIFLPSFIFTAITAPWVDSLRKSTITSTFLDSVNAAAVGLIGVTLLDMLHSASFTAPFFIIFLAASAASWKQINPGLILLTGALLGRLLGAGL